jgi:hypothetical protein
MNDGPATRQGVELRRRILQNLIGKFKKWTEVNESETPLRKKAGAEKPAPPEHVASPETSAVFSQTTLSAARQDIHLAFEYSSADQHPGS